MLLDHAEERAGVGRAHRLALVEHRRAAEEQRRVHDVGVPDHPADVRRGPEHVAGRHAVDVAQAPLQRDRVAAVVAHHALGHPRGARRVEDVERVGRLDRDRAGRRRARDRALPVDVAPGIERRLELRALQHQAVARLRARARDRVVEHRLVRHHAPRLDPARRGEHGGRRRVLDPLGELARGEAAEHHRVDRADPRAREHPEHRLGDHRHVDQHAVAALDAERQQRAREPRDLVLELRIAVGAQRARHRAVVDQRGLRAAPGAPRGGRPRCSRCSASHPETTRGAAGRCRSRPRAGAAPTRCPRRRAPRTRAGSRAIRRGRARWHRPSRVAYAARAARSRAVYDPAAAPGEPHDPRTPDRRPLARVRRQPHGALEPALAPADRRRARRRAPLPGPLLADRARDLRPARGDLLPPQARRARTWARSRAYPGCAG